MTPLEALLQKQAMLVNRIIVGSGLVIGTGVSIPVPAGTSEEDIQKGREFLADLRWSFEVTQIRGSTFFTLFPF